MHQVCSVDSSPSWAPQRSGWKKASLGGESLGFRCFEPFKQETMLVTSKQGQQFQREAWRVRQRVESALASVMLVVPFLGESLFSQLTLLRGGEGRINRM